MVRCTFIFKDKSYANIKADEFHEDGDYLKAYNGLELVGYFHKDEVIIAYRSEEKDIG